MIKKGDMFFSGGVYWCIVVEVTEGIITWVLLSPIPFINNCSVEEFEKSHGHLRDIPGMYRFVSI